MDRPTSLSIGEVAFGLGEGFSGLIDEVAIFNRALSEVEIKAIYDAGDAGMIEPPSAPSASNGR